MSDPRLGSSRAESAASGPGSERTTPGNPPGNQAVLGPFTVRDLAVFAGVLVTFIGSVLPMISRFQGALYPTLWNAGGLYFLGIGILLPLALAGLFVWRRLAPGTSIRIGSLSLDQFASVVALFSGAYFFVSAVTTGSVGGIVGFLGGAILVAATVFARFIPVLAGDFEGRAEVPAHIVARDAVAPAPKPAPQAAGPGPAAVPTSAPAAPQPQARSSAGVPWAGSYPHDDAEPAPAGEGTAEGGAGVTSASAAAAAAGFAGATAAGAGVASIAAGAMAAGEARSHEEKDAPDERTPYEPQESPQPEAVSAGPAQEAAAESPAAPEPSGLDVLAAEGIAEATDEAGPGVIAGDADGEVYGAPEPVAPAVEPDLGHTRMMPAAPASPSDQVAAPANFAEASPAVDRSAGIQATQRDEVPEPPYEAFWFAVSEQRSAVDPHSGLPVFTLEPGQWILALQDRGTEFLVQSQDGRVGVLRNLSGIERG